MIKTTENSENYTWGQNCQAWHLVKTGTLSVIEEKMPPGAQEALHYHQKAQQFFYVLEGTARFEIEGESFEISALQGIHIGPGKKHKVTNTGPANLHLLVISEP